MNKQRRKAVLEIIGKINNLYADVDDIKSLIANIKSEQDEAVSNVPDNLQNTERFEAMQNALECLEEAENEIDYALEHLSSTTDVLQEAIDD